MPAVFFALATVAFRQYARPPMSGGEGVAMLVSSHASTSRMTPELGLGGRGGDCTEGVRKGCGMSMGIVGTVSGDVASVAVAVQGAVRGR